MSKSITLWVVSGSFIIPGTREKGSFGPVRIADATKQAASQHLARQLNRQFSKELAKVNRQGGPHPFSFSDHFAMLQLKWEVYVSPRAKQEQLEQFIATAHAQQAVA